MIVPNDLWFIFLVHARAFEGWTEELNIGDLANVRQAGSPFGFGHQVMG